MRIFLIGSSFTNGIKPYLQMLIESSGRTATINVRAVDSWTLGYHYTSTKTMNELKDGHYDRVVLQEQSDGCTAAGSYPYIRGFNTIIREKGGLPVLMMTWRDRGDALSTYDALKGTVGDTDGPGYVPIGFEIDAAIAPAGWIFRTAVAANENVNLWNTDGHHANARGRYMAAMSVFCAIYGESPDGLNCPRAVRTTKALDQAYATTVAITGKATWNIE